MGEVKVLADIKLIDVCQKKRIYAVEDSAGVGHLARFADHKFKNGVKVMIDIETGEVIA